jgi:hypothetical protein
MSPRFFRVERVWKGRVPSVFSMPKVTWISTPCLPGFYESHVYPGFELLVYARHSTQFHVDGYVAEPGSRTTPISNAAEDLKKLGSGRPPTRDLIRRPPPAR